MSDLPRRPKAVYGAGCDDCAVRLEQKGIACPEHRSVAEWSWLAHIESIAGWRFPWNVPPTPTLF